MIPQPSTDWEDIPHPDPSCPTCGGEMEDGECADCARVVPLDFG